MTPFAFETRTLAQASGALVALPVEPARAHLVLADVLSRAPRSFALGLRLLIWLTPVFPILLMGRVCFFGNLSGVERSALWSRALSHRFWAVRQIALAYKMIACLCLFDFDVARAP